MAELEGLVLAPLGLPFPSCVTLGLTLAYLRPLTTSKLPALKKKGQEKEGKEVEEVTQASALDKDACSPRRVPTPHIRHT